MLPILETKNLTKLFGSFAANENVSLKIAPSKIHAIVGENGAGKSTLLKMLFGLYQPSSGEIFLRGESVHWKSPLNAISKGLGMVQQHFCLVDTLSAIENIVLGAEPERFGIIQRQRAIEKLDKILPSPFLSVPWDEKVENLSVGVKQKVEVLKLLYRESEILFLDEPTAVLAPQETRDFFEVLKNLRNLGKTIVLITHKVSEIMELCDEFSVLKNGKLVATGQISGTSPEKLVELMIGRPFQKTPSTKANPDSQLALEVKDLSDLDPSRGAFKNISMKVHLGEIVGIAGVEGSGQKNFIEAIMGLRAFTGNLNIMGKNIKPRQTKQVRAMGVGLIPEDRKTEGLWGEQSCLNNMIIGIESEFSSKGWLNRKKIATITPGWAQEFDVRASSWTIPAQRLSGGNQQKLIFAREIRGRDPRLLICNKPTRGVDWGASELLHKKILEFKTQQKAVLLLSSDLDELMFLSDRLYVFFDGRISAHFLKDQFESHRIGRSMTSMLGATNE